MKNKWSEQECQQADNDMFKEFGVKSRGMGDYARKLTLQRNMLRSALQNIADKLNPDSAESYRSDDPEGAMDSSFSVCQQALSRSEVQNG